MLKKKNILYEDNHLLVLNKSAGQLVHSDITGDSTLLDEAKEYIKVKYDKPGKVYLHPLHRLDRPVSGAVLFARTEKALKRLQVSFKAGDPQKEYLAVTHNKPLQIEQELRHHMKKNESINKSFISKPKDSKAKLAILRYRHIASNSFASLLQIKLVTGRSHQIRLQLSTIKCPIIGDSKYGSVVKSKGTIMLHAYRLAFIHPVKKEQISIQAALPDQWFKTKYFIDFKDIVDNQYSSYICAR